ERPLGSSERCASVCRPAWRRMPRCVWSSAMGARGVSPTRPRRRPATRRSTRAAVISRACTVGKRSDVPFLKRRPAAFAMAVLAVMMLWHGRAYADVVLRGDRTFLDAQRLEDLVRLELGGDAGESRVIVDVSGGRASVVLERRLGAPRTAVVQLASKD